jgi:hypothetical protein
MPLINLDTRNLLAGQQNIAAALVGHRYEGTITSGDLRPP